MNRRTFLKTVTGAAVAAGSTGVARRATGAMPERITVAGVGDCIPARRLTQRRDPELTALIELLRGIDCVWANCETVFGDPRGLSAWPKGVDPHILCEPWGADLLRHLGIDFVGTANNHSFDWGPEGMLSTLEHLDRVGIPQAGCGPDLAMASRPGYVDSPAGRVAQVNCASSFSDYGAAGPAHPHVRGKAGLNALPIERVLQLPQSALSQLDDVTWKLMELRGWATAFGDTLKALMEERMPEGAVLLDETMAMPGEEIDLLESVAEAAQTRITDALGVARNNARLVIASIHAHESRHDLDRSPVFLERFARATIDAGADVFFATGPHVLRGIELYRGKPIFYGLGNFLFHYETAPVTPAGSYTGFGLPPDTVDRSELAARIPYPSAARYWQSAIPVITFEGGHGVAETEPDGPRATSIDLHPITLGYGLPLYERGTPERARGEEATAILEGLARLSAPYGTSLAIDGDTARVVLG